MENASKALVMAGGVLIGVLLLSLAVYLFADFGSTSARINAQNAQQQIVEFNSRFTAYENYKDKDGNWQITIYDIISLASYVKEYNAYNDEEQIDVKISNRTILEETNKGLLSAYVDVDGNLTKFECLSISYGDSGKVTSINFKQTT